MPLIKLMYNEMKLVVFNVMTLGISFSSLEMSLKIILLSVTIGYTLHKWVTIKSKK